MHGKDNSMISVTDVIKLPQTEIEIIEQEETKIDAELSRVGTSLDYFILIIAPHWLDSELKSFLKEKYKRGGWYIKENAWKNWEFYPLLPPATNCCK